MQRSFTSRSLAATLILKISPSSNPSHCGDPTHPTLMMAAHVAIKFLLALLHGVDDTESFVARAINAWRMYFFQSSMTDSNDLHLASDLCDAPANHEELLGHVDNIWQEVSFFRDFFFRS